MACERTCGDCGERAVVPVDDLDGWATVRRAGHELSLCPRCSRRSPARRGESRERVED